MKSLGSQQFLSMKFERLPLSEEWTDMLGNLPANFTILFYGPSGSGKTECCLQLVREMNRHGKVEWLEYESGHAADIQDGARRNGLGKIPVIFTDPWVIQKVPTLPPYDDIPMGPDDEANQLLIDLVDKMAKKKSAKYFFINSIDAAGFSSKQILYLMRKFGKRKGLIFIGLSDGKTLQKGASKTAYSQGQACFFVKNYIAGATKTRFDGWGKRVVYELKARELDPLYFEQAQQKIKTTKKPKKAKA